jgi:hypothetical protein
MKKIGLDLDWLAGQPVQILDDKSKSWPCKNLDSLNLESGTTLPKKVLYNTTVSSTIDTVAKRQI